MKKIAAVIIVAALIVAGVFIYLTSVKEAGNGQLEVRTAKVVRGDLLIEVAASGTVTPDVEVIVKSKAGGEITSFPFNEGDIVEKGQAVVDLDPSTELARKNQAEANLMMAKAREEKASVALKDAGVKHRRHRQLYDEGIISRQELDDAEIVELKARSDVKIAEAERFQMSEALKEAQERLDDTRIRAPFTGTILKKFVDRGQVISSTLSSASEGTQIFSMANLDNIYVSAQVDEVDITRIEVGQSAAASVDSLPERLFSGVVARIAPKGKVDRTVTVFDVVVEITDEGKSLLRPGMTATVKMLVDRVDGALLVPREALKLKDGKTGVYVMKAGKPGWVPVTPGMTDGITSEVEGGLSPGDEVVVSDIEKGNNRKKRILF